MQKKTRATAILSLLFIFATAMIMSGCSGKGKDAKGAFIEFPEGLTWFNVPRPLTMDELKGHVVLLDFWTYSCINCIHAIPKLKTLEEKYEYEPVVFIGVHSPKFENEKKADNVRSAIL